MTSELLAAVIDGMSSDFAGPDADVRATRTMMAPLHGHPLRPDTEVRIITAGGVRCGWLSTPATGHEHGAAVFFHGGAFVSCDLEAYLFYAEFIADHLRVPVVTIDYRLAPEHRFPAAFNDCTAAFSGLIDDGLVPERAVFVGDSCGGGLALATARWARDTVGAGPAGIVSLSGWVDLDTLGYGPRGPAGPDPFISEAFLRNRARDYLGPGGDLWDTRASPSRGDLSHLPPLLLQVGEVDVTRLDAERLASAARAVGSDARVDIVRGGIHGIQGLVGMEVPEAMAAWASVTKFAEAVLGS